MISVTLEHDPAVRRPDGGRRSARPADAPRLDPLDAFYREAGSPAPRPEPLAGADLPPVPRRLLDHGQDMTGTLEAYVGAALRLRPLSMRRSGNRLSREVVLVTDDERAAPIEFGAICIHLDRLDAEPRRRTEQCERPLGGILNECAVEYRCVPSGFFRMPSDELTTAALELAAPTLLYGRHNVIYDGADAVLAEVVEILAPLDGWPQGRGGAA